MLHQIQLITQTTPPLIPLDVDGIRSADTETLRRHLEASINLTAQTLAYWGALWAELERRGEDLSALRRGVMEYMPLIAYGHLDPHLVVRYTNKRTLLLAVSRMPPTIQEKILQEGHMLRVDVTDDGEKISQRVPLERINAQDIRFLFAEDRLRSETEQFVLRQKANVRRKRNPPKARRARRAELNRTDKTLEAAGVAIPIDSAIELLGEYLGFDLRAIIEREENTRKAFSGKVR